MGFRAPIYTCISSVICIGKIMKNYLLIALAASVLASPTQNVQQIPIPEKSEMENDYPAQESYIDQLYGPLVSTPDSLQHRRQLVASGVQSYKEEEQFIESFPFSDGQWLTQNIQKMHLNQQKSHRNAAHSGYLKYRLQVKFPNDDETSDISNDPSHFGGIITFGGFDHFDCFNPQHYKKPIDIAIVGAPFDTGTSYRPGARFGPEAIRLAARRLGGGVTPVRGNGPQSKLGQVDPYDRRTHNLSIIDCGDVPMTPFDNRIALNQLYRGQRAIHNHSVSAGAKLVPHPKIITMGGDHTITLMALRSAYEKYGKLAVLHFDSHIDTWDPKVLGGGITDYMSLNHGTFLHYAAENGYLEQGHCFHLGLRAPYIRPSYDKKHDSACGFETISARDLDRLGMHHIVTKIKESVKDMPVYISVDIDVLDPANAPGTGTMEIGGWTGRELLSVLDGLEGINLVGGDVVEVSPPFDTNSEITSLAATAVIDSLLGLMVVEEM